MTKDDEELLAGAATFIRHQPLAFRDRMFEMVRQLTTDVPFYKDFILTHYDDKPDTDDVYIFYARMHDLPSPRGDWRTGAFFKAVSDADASRHTNAAEVIDAVIMECFYRQQDQLSGLRDHFTYPRDMQGHGGWKADS